MMPTTSIGIETDDCAECWRLSRDPGVLIEVCLHCGATIDRRTATPAEPRPRRPPRPLGASDPAWMGHEKRTVIDMQSVARWRAHGTARSSWTAHGPATSASADDVDGKRIGLRSATRGNPEIDIAHAIEVGRKLDIRLRALTLARTPGHDALVWLVEQGGVLLVQQRTVPELLGYAFATANQRRVWGAGSGQWLYAADRGKAPWRRAVALWCEVPERGGRVVAVEPVREPEPEWMSVEWGKRLGAA